MSDPIEPLTDDLRMPSVPPERELVLSLEDVAKRVVDAYLMYAEDFDFPPKLSFAIGVMAGLLEWEREAET